jgi:hypothetical protein
MKNKLKRKRVGGMAQVVELKALSSIPDKNEKEVENDHQIMKCVCHVVSDLLCAGELEL